VDRGSRDGCAEQLIVVSTGGHLQGVERFAITGVRSGSPTAN
jgi:hypothetical protein